MKHLVLSFIFMGVYLVETSQFVMGQHSVSMPVAKSSSPEDARVYDEQKTKWIKENAETYKQMSGQVPISISHTTQTNNSENDIEDYVQINFSNSVLFLSNSVETNNAKQKEEYSNMKFALDMDNGILYRKSSVLDERAKKYNFKIEGNRFVFTNCIACNDGVFLLDNYTQHSLVIRLKEHLNDTDFVIIYFNR